eukprot:Seg1646.7 transcript_id=Seg1646.7/GoldUCD/mRNA.D3Y31 product="hypothetical protein" protein_id=Seg1646.7/GoldUCD/D3Y31
MHTIKRVSTTASRFTRVASPVTRVGCKNGPNTQNGGGGRTVQNIRLLSTQPGRLATLSCR